MQDPILTLFKLTDQILELDMVQGWINNARLSAPTNQVVQLELDRQQGEIDRKRVLIDALMADIRSRN